MNANPAHPRARRPAARRGLTLAELILGTAMLGIVMMAAAGLMAAVAASWKGGDAIARTSNVSERAGQRVEDAVGSAMYVFQTQWVGNNGGGNGNVKTGLFYWADDAVTGVADGKAQFGEAGLIVYDNTSKALLLYEAMPRASMTSVQLAAAEQADWGDPTDPAIVNYWLSQPFVAAPRTLVGGQAGASTVTAATFSSFAPAGAKPSVGFSLSIDQNGLPVTRDGVVTLRRAQRPRNLP